MSAVPEAGKDARGPRCEDFPADYLEWSFVIRLYDVTLLPGTISKLAIDYRPRDLDIKHFIMVYGENIPIKNGQVG